MERFKLIFEKKGEVQKYDNHIPNEVWLDVGNKLEMGFFDHHQKKDLNSTISAVINNTKFLEDLKRSYEEGKVINVHIHEEPDLDCISSYYVVRLYLEDNEKYTSLFGENRKALSFCDLVDDIDKGKRKVTTYPTFYAIYTALDGGMEKGEATDTHVVDQGFKLIDIVLTQLAEDPNIDLGTMDLTKITGIKELFNKEINIIEESHDLYISEKAEGAVSIYDKIKVWKKEGDQDVDVKAGIWNRAPSTDNAYDYARKDDECAITVVPKKAKGVGDDETTIVTISVNMDDPKNADISLFPWAEVLEQMEQLEEERVFEETGRYRRDHSRTRANKEYFKEMPFAVTSDPWYISLNEDMLASPREGSILDYNVILDIIKCNGSRVKKSYVLQTENENVEERNAISLSKWQDSVKKDLKNAPGCTVVWAELDSSLISKNNNILEAYCHNLTGRSYSESRGSNILYMDYRTCIYADVDCIIILSATYEDDDGKTEPVINSLIDTSDKESFKQSPLIKDIVTIVNQRTELLDIGNRIGELAQKWRRKDIERLNARLLMFSARMQREDIKKGAEERKIYDFIKQEFGISSLMDSITEEMSVIVSEFRDKLVSKFNALAAFAVPFVLISTLFQMGMIRFDALFTSYANNDKTGNIIGWIVVFAVIFLIMAVIALWGKLGSYRNCKERKKEDNNSKAGEA